MGVVTPEGGVAADRAWSHQREARLLMGVVVHEGGVVVHEGGVVSPQGRGARLRPQECAAPPAPPPAANRCSRSFCPARWRPPPRSAALPGMQAGLTN